MDWHLIGASRSEPLPSGVDGDFVYIYILDRCLSIVRGEPEQANMAHACENDCMGRYM